jgi:hypothetical protein
MDEQTKTAMFRGFKAELEKLGLGMLALTGIQMGLSGLMGAFGKLRKGPKIPGPRIPGT